MTTTTIPKSNSSNLLEEALDQPLIGETANFAWNATPLGIAAIYKGISPSKPPYEQAIKEGKPENIVEKIAQGKLQKFFKENTLLSQPFVKDNSMTIESYLGTFSSDLTVDKFLRVSIG